MAIDSIASSCPSYLLVFEFPPVDCRAHHFPSHEFAHFLPPAVRLCAVVMTVGRRP